MCFIERMKTIRILLIFIYILIFLTYPSVYHGIENVRSTVINAERQDEMIIVRIDEKTFTCYRFGTGQKYPYFFPVNGPVSGVSVTTESSLPYPHHRSLFFGLDRVNEANYWQEGNDRGQIVSRGPRIVKNGPDSVVISDECEWRQPGKKPIILDKRNIIITAPSENLRIIDFSISLAALTDIHVEKTNHSLFSARMHETLSVLNGGVLVNADGDMNQEGTVGKKSPWCDYYGTRFGIVEGLAIFDSPYNPWYPSPWVTRDYGFFSPTPMNWLDENGFSLKNGDYLDLQYRVVVHTGDSKQIGIEKLFDEWVESFKH